jgi:NAD-dependent SIR2 family protein deacetylase
MSLVVSPQPSSSKDASDVDVAAEAVREFLDRHPRVFVLTGAGCSTESGIPDYRSADGSWKRQQPVQFAAFLRDPGVRARYWARSLIGWRSIFAAQPNASHHALASLEHRGRISLLATQNVDGLHQAAGSRRVMDLHGRIDRVACMTCRHGSRRAAWQRRLDELNADWSRLEAPTAPDGDADLDGLDFGGFAVPPCPRCGGIVKPDVVFFGESVPPSRHAQAKAALDTSDAMLVVGSSLMVHSGYRYALAAHRLAKPIAAVNIGVTRADALFDMKVEAPAGDTLSAAVD